jgi:hypothetical protein
MTNLTIIEAPVKVQPKNQEHTHQNKKHLENGSHEWDNCQQNPKNQKNDERIKIIEAIAAMEEETEMAIEIMKNTDVSREMDGNHPANEPKIKTIVGSKIVVTWIVKKSTIAFVVAITMIKVQMKKQPVQKY